MSTSSYCYSYSYSCSKWLRDRDRSCWKQSSPFKVCGAAASLIG